MKRKIVGLVLVAMFLVGCAFSIKPTIEQKVYTYEEVGYMLIDTKLILQTMEVAGALKGDLLIEAKSNYNKARELYIKAGDLMKEMIDIDDIKIKKIKLTDYRAMLREAAQLIIKYAQKEESK